jgi:hypothetical protein
VRVAALFVLASLLSACFAPLPDATPELAWASYQAPTQPRYRLIFEGTTDGRDVRQVRIIDPSGAVIASVPTTLASAETLLLCGGGKSGSPRPFGPSRATFAVSAELFTSFLEAAERYRVEADLGRGWRPATVKLICSATID